MYVTIAHFLNTPSRGWFLKPRRKWNYRHRLFKFRVRGETYYDYVKCSITRKSVSGWANHVKDALVSVKSYI